MIKLRALFPVALIFACAAAQAAPLIPPALCRELRPAGPEALELARQSAPDLAQGMLKELPTATALTLISWAQTRGLSGLELFTDDGFRGECVFYLSHATLQAADKRYDLDLATQISGTDLDGKPFQMAALLVGKGKLVAIYDRDEVRYHNDRYDRDFKMSRTVRFDAPEPGLLNNIEGLWAHAGILGNLAMHEFRRTGPHTLKVNVGGFIKENTLRPIVVRGGAAENRPSAESREPAAALESSASDALDSLRGMALPSTGL